MKSNIKEVPELTDEVANELDSNAETVDEYKENLRKRLSEQKLQKLKILKKKKQSTKLLTTQQLISQKLWLTLN